MPDPIRDEELMAATAAGDAEAFQTIVSRHQAAVFRFVTSIESDRGRAEDALQETFLSLWRHASSWRGDTPLRHWLLSIARHAVMRGHRKRAGEPDRMESLDELGERAGWGSEDPEGLAEQSQKREILIRALRSLGSADQEIIVLRDLEGLTGAEAAALTGVTEGGQKARLHRARLRLAGALRKELGHA